jgi:hypothetical protein
MLPVLCSKNVLTNPKNCNCDPHSPAGAEGRLQHLYGWFHQSEFVVLHISPEQEGQRGKHHCLEFIPIFTVHAKSLSWTLHQWPHWATCFMVWHMAHKLDDDQMVWSTATKIKQGTSGIQAHIQCNIPRVATEWREEWHRVWYINLVKPTKLVGENLMFTYVCSNRWTMYKWPVSVHNDTGWQITKYLTQSRDEIKSLQC